MGDIKDTTTKDKIFVLHKIADYIKEQPDYEQMKSLYDAVFKPFFDRWNVDWESAPDYSKGLQIAGEAYGETFRNAIVDGQEALG
jgi:hypothetical protein